MRQRVVNCKKTSEYGFSTAEALVSLVLFVIAALITITMTINTVRTNSSNSLRTKATSAIQDKIENLRLDVKAGKTITSGQDTTSGLKRTWTVYANQPSVGLSTVVVEVDWSQAPLKDARFLKYASILGND